MAAYCPGTLGFELVTTQETVATMFRVEHTDSVVLCSAFRL